MAHNHKGKSKIILLFFESFQSFLPVLKNKYFYIGLAALVFGALLNIASQTYLHYYMTEGKTLPMLSDLILDNLPVIDLSLIYDIFCIISLIIFLIYIADKKEYNKIPYFLLMCGIFMIVRGIFIVLTPFGNPPMFYGSDRLFNGFSRYELGVYPSGHVGNTFMYLLLLKDKYYKRLLFICLMIIIISLFLAHGHYSIDIFSGLFFAYAIRCFGDKYLTMFNLNNKTVTRLSI